MHQSLFRLPSTCSEATNKEVLSRSRYVLFRYAYVEIRALRQELPTIRNDCNVILSCNRQVLLFPPFARFYKPAPLVWFLHRDPIRSLIRTMQSYINVHETGPFLRITK